MVHLLIRKTYSNKVFGVTISHSFSVTRYICNADNQTIDIFIQIMYLEANTWGKILFLGPQVVALIICNSFSSCNIYMYIIILVH